MAHGSRSSTGALALIPLLSLAIAPPAHAQAGIQDLTSITAKIRVETERILRDTGIPAISIALIREGEVVWSEAYGYANVGAGVRASADTYFSTGSTLKPVTAAAIMQLIEAGCISTCKGHGCLSGCPAGRRILWRTTNPERGILCGDHEAAVRGQQFRSGNQRL